MIFLALLGIAAYFILPILLVTWLLFKKFDVNLDPAIVCWGMFFVEFAFAIQIAFWVWGK